MTKLADNLVPILRSELAGLIGGAWEDIDRYATAAAADLERAILAGDADLTDELRAQVRALGEKHRLRLNNAAWASVHAVFSVILRTAAAVGG